MVNASEVREGMTVLAADGEAVGTVDVIEGQRMRLEAGPVGGGEPRYLPLVWISRINGRVHLKRTAAELRASWGMRGADAGTDKLLDAHQGGGANWVPRVLLGAGLAVLAYAALM